MQERVEYDRSRPTGRRREAMLRPTSGATVRACRPLDSAPSSPCTVAVPSMWSARDAMIDVYTSLVDSFWILWTPLAALVSSALVGYRVSALRAVRNELRESVHRLDREVAGLGEIRPSSASQLRRLIADHVVAHRQRLTREVKVEDLRADGAERVRWGALHAAGLNTLDDLRGWSRARLCTLPGVGDASADKIVIAVQRRKRAVESASVPLPSPGRVNNEDLVLLATAQRVVDCDALLAPVLDQIERARRGPLDRFRAIDGRLGFAGWAFRELWASGETRVVASARVLTEEFAQLLTSEVLLTARAVGAELQKTPRADAVRTRFADDAGPILTCIEANGADASFARDRRSGRPSTSSPAKPGTPASVPIRSDRRLPKDWHAWDPARGVSWVPPGESVEFLGRSIPGGMLYIAVGGPHPQDPCILDPWSEVATDRVDRAGASMPYWPWYGSILPECRRAYLDWLEHGRRDASYGVGYAFLFFYGLERRILRERELCSDAEIATIVAECERLLEMYADSRSFQSYVGTFVTLTKAAMRGARPDDEPPPSALHPGPPIALRLALAQFAAIARPLPAGWALTWYLSIPGTGAVTAAARCPEKLLHLFTVRYDRELSGGPVLVPGSKRLDLTYRPASAGFRGPVQFATELTDVVVRGVPDEIRRIGDSCVRDLDAYVRASRRTALHPLALAALLPTELASRSESSQLERLRDWLDATVPQTRPVVVPASALLEQWQRPMPQRLTKREVTEVARVLGRLGFGMDPDPRFGGGTLRANDSLALVRLPDSAGSMPSGQFEAASLMVRLCAAVATADDESSGEERRQLLEVVSAMDGVDEAERLRLQAQAVRMMQTRVALGSVARFGRTFSPESLDRLGSLLVRIAAADGRVSPSEVSILVKVFRALGLDPARVYSLAHSLTAGTEPASEPVVVRHQVANKGAGQFRIPDAHRRADSDGGRVEIDENLLAQKRAEAAEVLEMLAPIFQDDLDDQTVSPTPSAPSSSVAGLDWAHAGLLVRLADRASWTRAEFESLCDDLGLLPDGALEVLNDAAFERFDAPVVEGDDPLDVDQDAVRSWLS